MKNQIQQLIQRYEPSDSGNQSEREDLNFERSAGNAWALQGLLADLKILANGDDLQSELTAALKKLMNEARRVWIERSEEYKERTPDAGWLKAWWQAEVILEKAEATPTTQK